MSDSGMVICPHCVHEFRAIPEDVQRELVELREDAARYKADYLSACKTVADMHEAATGRRGEAPWMGVVEDVAAAAMPKRAAVGRLVNLAAKLMHPDTMRKLWQLEEHAGRTLGRRALTVALEDADNNLKALALEVRKATDAL